MAFALAAALAFSSLAGWPNPGVGAIANAAPRAAAVIVIAIWADFRIRNLLLSDPQGVFLMSAVLRTSRDQFSVRQRHDPQKPGARTVPGAACFEHHGLAEGVLKVHLGD